MRQDWSGSTVFMADCLSGTSPFVTEAGRTVSRYDSKNRIAELNNYEQTMPVAYVISAVAGFVDEEAVRRYAELAGPAIARFGGRFIVSNAEPILVEGESPSRHLSMGEFPSIDDAKAWYDSPENAVARAVTPAAFSGRVLMFLQGV